MYVSSEPCSVTTIVGSCVAVCVWHPIVRVGGVTHFILPQWDGAGQSSCRYGDIAIEMLITKMNELAGSGRKMQAHIFGGACMFEVLRRSQLGTANVEIALKLLSSYGLEVVTKQVGGSKGRKVVFQTSDGTFTVKEI